MDGLATVGVGRETAKHAQKARTHVAKLLAIVNATTESRPARLFAVEVAVAITDATNIFVTVLGVIFLARFLGRAEVVLKFRLGHPGAVFVCLTLCRLFLLAAARFLGHTSSGQVRVELLAIVIATRQSVGARGTTSTFVSVVTLAITQTTTLRFAVFEVRTDTLLHAAAEPAGFLAIRISVALWRLFATITSRGHSHLRQVRMEVLTVVDTALQAESARFLVGVITVTITDSTAALVTMFVVVLDAYLLGAAVPEFRTLGVTSTCFLLCRVHANMQRGPC